MNLGYNISRIRENARLKQSYVALKSNIPVRTYQRIEAGQSPLTEERLQKISTVLHTSPDVIRTFDEALLPTSTVGGYCAGPAIYQAAKPGEVPDPKEMPIQRLLAQILLLEERVKRLEATCLSGT